MTDELTQAMNDTAAARAKNCHHGTLVKSLIRNALKSGAQWMWEQLEFAFEKQRELDRGGHYPLLEKWMPKDRFMWRMGMGDYVFCDATESALKLMHDELRAQLETTQRECEQHKMAAKEYYDEFKRLQRKLMEK